MRSSRTKCRERKAKAEVTLKDPYVQTCVANKELMSETEEKLLPLSGVPGGCGFLAGLGKSASSRMGVTCAKS